MKREKVRSKLKELLMIDDIEELRVKKMGERVLVDTDVLIDYIKGFINLPKK